MYKDYYFWLKSQSLNGKSFCIPLSLLSQLLSTIVYQEINKQTKKQKQKNKKQANMFLAAVYVNFRFASLLNYGNESETGTIKIGWLEIFQFKDSFPN